MTRQRNELVLAPRSTITETPQDYYLVPEEGILNPIKLEISSNVVTHPLTANHALLNKEKLDFPLILRRWKKGDIFYPTGMIGKKKVAKFFKDEKMSTLDKEKQWLLCSGGDIVWVVGKRINRKFEAVANTTMLHIQLA